MAAFCLLPEYADKFLDALRSGELSPEKLADMTSAERREAFAPYVGAESAHELNAQFESKLLLKSQQRGMVNWAKKAAGLTEPARRDIVSKIAKMDRVLDPEEGQSFLEDLAAQKLGVGVTEEEARNIFQLAKAADEVRTAGADNFAGVSNEYLKAVGDLRGYIDSLKPTTPLKSIGMNAMVLARNNLLFNPSTPLKTVLSQVENSAIDAITRRVSTASLSGFNAGMATAAKNEAWKTYRETGLNVAAMEGMNVTGRLGEGNRFDLITRFGDASGPVLAAEKAVSTLAKWSNKIIIDWAHVVPFTKAYQGAFYDMLNIFSSKLAKSDGLTGDAARARAAELLQDAARVEPETATGAALRQTAQQQAARITSTNMTWMSTLAMAMKDKLNAMAPGVGDALMPIAKIPANVIWNGIENAGAGIPLGVRDIFLGRQKMQSADMARRYEGAGQLAGGVQKLVRTFGAIAVAAYFADQMQPSDFRQDRYGANFVRIGNVWVNLEYVSAISPAVAGMMAAKAHESPGQDLTERLGHYVAGAAAGLKEAPGINEINELTRSITNSDVASGIKKYAETFFTSRGLPAFVQNLGKDRPVDRLFFGVHGVETEEDVEHDKYHSAVQRTRENLSVWGDVPHTAQDNDPVNKELETIRYTPGFPGHTISGVKLTDGQYKQYVLQSGTLAHARIEEFMQSPGYDALPAPARRSAVTHIVDESRKVARASIIGDSRGSPNDIAQKAADARAAKYEPAGVVQ